MPPGRYCLEFLGPYSQVAANFTLTARYSVKPYKRWFPLGLTLLEVGLPIIITGAVILSFGYIGM